MDFDRENPSPLARLPGGADTNWHDWSPELETAYLQHIAGVERLEDATSLQLVVNTSAGGSVAHLGTTLPNLQELNLSGSTLDSLRDLGTGFRLLQVLWVSRCGLKALDGLNGLPALRELYAAYNDVADLQPLDCCTLLEVLDVECNCIADPDAVLYLTGCSHLQTLTLAGNPAALKPGYRQAVLGALPALHCLDDEPVTPADRNILQQQQQPNQQQPSQQHPSLQHGRSGGGGDDGSGSRSSGGGRQGGDVLLPPPLRAAAAAAFSPRQSFDGPALASPSGGSAARAGSGPAAAVTAPPPPPDADEIAFVVAGIKHARVGVDSHEFREIEMNLLVATADGTEVQLDVRPGTSTLLPASASTWVRTLRSSREGSLAALRASAAAAAASAVSSYAAAGRTGSQSPTSQCSASPISSRPPSSQQQRAGGGPAAAAAATVERWAIPAGPGAGMLNSFGAQGAASSVAGGGGTRRPSSGTGILSGGGAGPGGMTGTVDSPMRPGSGGYRLGTARPYSARPGTAASFSARVGTSASTGAAPASASAGLYWAKNRISGGSAAGGGAGGGADGGGAADGGAGADADVAGSKLTLGSDTTFGGSFARDLRKWKGAAVRAAAAAAAASGGDVGAAAAAAAAVASPSLGGSHGISSTLRRDGQLDPRALLEELKRWKLETADRVLFVDPDESTTDDGWVDGLDRTAGSSGGGGGAAAADILRLTSSQDGAAPELAAAFGLNLQLLEQPPSALEAAGGGGGGGAAYSPVPGSPLQPLRPPPGSAAAGRRKMVLAKVLRDIAADTISSSGICISEILAGLRPVHAPPAYGISGGGGPYTPGVAWGPPGSADSSSSRERDKSGGRASAATTPTAGDHPHTHQQHRHQHPHQNQHSHSKSPHAPASQHQQQYQQKHHHHYHQQQQHQQQAQPNQAQGGGGGGGGSARSVCSSSGQSDCSPHGTGGGATQSSRPGSREEQPPVGGGGGGGSSSVGGGGVGPQLQRQRSASRAPGIPAGPSAPATAAPTAPTYRVGSAAS